MQAGESLRKSTCLEIDVQRTRQVLALPATRYEEALAMRGKVAQGIDPSATL